MKKFLLCMMIVMMSVAAEGYGTFSGKWNIYGEGFAEKGFVRTQLEINGDINISACSFSELSPDIVNVMSEDWETLISRDEIDGIYTFFDFLTSISMSLRVYASSLGIKIYEENMPNEITDPHLFLDFLPSLEEPLELPALDMGGLSLQMTLTSEDAGTIRIKGPISTSYMGNIDLDTECAIWKDGTVRPPITSSASGCDSGVGIMAVVMMMMIAGVKKFVRN